MSTPTMTPPGWYKDPTGRHDSRYWDSTHWTPQVSDAGVVATEAPLSTPGYPPPPLAQPTFGGPPPAHLPSGFRAVAVPRWRAAAVRVAAVALGAAFAFELIASLSLAGTVGSSTYNSSPPSEGTLEWSAWLFHYAFGVTTYTYPPLLLWPALIVAFIMAGQLGVAPAIAIRRAGGQRFGGSAAAVRARMASALREMGCAPTVLRAGGRHARVIVGELFALAVTGLSAYAIIAKQGVFQETGTFTDRGALSVGLGPKVCLVAGIFGVVALALAWPLRGDRIVQIFADGSVRPEQLGGPPLPAPPVLPPPPPPVSSAPVPPAAMPSAPVPPPSAPPPVAPEASGPSFAGFTPPYVTAPEPRKRPWLVAAVVLGVLLLAAGVLLWAPWKGPDVPSPGELVAGKSTTSSLTFRWSAPAEGQVPDQYVIVRNGEDIATVEGTVTSYVDKKVDPATRYSYRVVAVQGGDRSTPTGALQMTTRKPPLSSARLQGTFDTVSKVTQSGGGNVTTGTSMEDTWKFTPKCKSGACPTALSGALGGGEFTPHPFKMSLAREGSRYSGQTTAHVTHCSGDSVHDTLTLRVRVTKAETIDGVWTATGLSGTLVEKSPYTSAGGLMYCPEQTHTMSIRASAG